MTRALVILGVAAALLVAAYAHGRQAGAAKVRAELAADAEEARADQAAREAARLTIQGERDRMARELEDLAYAAPVTADHCLPADRVHRLNALR